MHVILDNVIIIWTSDCHNTTCMHSVVSGIEQLNRECAFGLSDRGRGGSRLPACILRSSSSVK